MLVAAVMTAEGAMAPRYERLLLPREQARVDVEA